MELAAGVGAAGCDATKLAATGSFFRYGGDTAPCGACAELTQYYRSVCHSDAQGLEWCMHVAEVGCGCCERYKLLRGTRTFGSANGFVLPSCLTVSASLAHDAYGQGPLCLMPPVTVDPAVPTLGLTGSEITRPINSIRASLFPSDRRRASTDVVWWGNSLGKYSHR